MLIIEQGGWKYVTTKMTSSIRGKEVPMNTLLLTIMTSRFSHFQQFFFHCLIFHDIEKKTLIFNFSLLI